MRAGSAASTTLSRKASGVMRKRFFAAERFVIFAFRGAFGRRFRAAAPSRQVQIAAVSSKTERGDDEKKLRFINRLTSFWSESLNMLEMSALRMIRNLIKTMQILIL
ncbi:MAG: hypothetical protein KAH44_13245 [Oricola sp.]|nr:hypothetical protein [Oricola sp.]